MRIMLSISFVLLLIMPLQAQVGLEWSEPIVLSTAGKKSPVVGVLGNGTPVAIWGNGSKIYFSKMEGEVFSTPVQVSTNGISPNIYSFGGIDMAVKGNQIHIVFENFSNGIYDIRSMDGGETFEAPVSVYDPPSHKWATLASVEIDDNGNPLVSVIFENTDETEGKYIMMTSTDGGESFMPPVIANEQADGGFVCECCPSDIYTKGDDVWLIFRNNDNNLRDMWVSKSTDGAATFEVATDVDATDWQLNACPISGPKMTPLGEDSLLTVWVSGANGGSRLSISTLSAETMENGFETEMPQTNTGAAQKNGTAASHGDTLGIVWAENGFGANGFDLLFAFSTEGTTNLLTNIANITADVGSQTRPSLVFQNGVFHLINDDGQFGLEYRKGVVGSLDAVNTLESTSLNIQLLQQPIQNGSIHLKSFHQNQQLPFFAQLHAISGHIIQEWNTVYAKSNGEIQLKTQNTPAGLYLLSLLSKEGYWQSKVLIIN